MPTPKALPAPQQAKPAPVMAPPPPTPVTPSAPLPKQVTPAPTAPPPTLVQGAADTEPVVKKAKSKRRQLQQASQGTSALRIPLNTGVESSPTGLNIPS